MVDYNLKRLKESIPTTSLKIIELYNRIDSEQLIPRPNYQRKLVWKKQHKYAFIDTILLNYPFPEVYIASSEIDVENMITKEVVVDGQQRLTTIVDYIKGEGDFSKQKKIVAFQNLSPDDKKVFLNYPVSVKDLKDIGEDTVKEIFQRINSTEYSLNTVEKNNAQFGDGEIAIFCKQLVEPIIEFKPTEDETDIIISDAERNFFLSFLKDNEIFTDNDKKRMYDFQYFMLMIISILEGDYFGRNSKVDEYLEKYNSEFPYSKTVLAKLSKAFNVIISLELPIQSYWFNKANLFTLTVELAKLDNTEDIDIGKLEIGLNELESKVDLYFDAEDEEEIKDISEDERKYFEVARHGSHEKAARDHRAKVVFRIIKDSINVGLGTQMESDNIEYLKSKEIPYAILRLTKTGLDKNILDAITAVRTFLKSKGIHDYKSQELGPDKKVKITSYFYKEDGSMVESTTSLYRSNGRGDYRIWFNGLQGFASRDEEIALVYIEEKLLVLNVSSIDYSKLI